jgi:predicted GNAT superfamily acetyltransferase
MTNFTYRDLSTEEDLFIVQKLEQEVWMMEDLAVVPDEIMKVVLHCGGHMAGAFDGERMIGFTMGMPARHGTQWRLWSHMSAVSHDYRGMGVGFSLKAFQREWALRNGYDTIAWTFDPFQRVNANFNLRRLGAIGTHYHENFYGTMHDEINKGMPTDRMEVVWELANARVVDHAYGAPQPVLIEAHDEHFIVSSDENGLPILKLPRNFTNICYFVEVPTDLPKLRQASRENILAWRNAHRQAIAQAMSIGYHAVDFTNADTRCWYVLYRMS